MYDLPPVPQLATSISQLRFQLTLYVHVRYCMNVSVSCHSTRRSGGFFFSKHAVKTVVKYRGFQRVSALVQLCTPMDRENDSNAGYYV